VTTQVLPFIENMEHPPSCETANRLPARRTQE
jgi:hypothetical protein